MMFPKCFTRRPLSVHAFHPHFEGAENFDELMIPGYSPHMVKKAYSYDENVSGKGVKIAVVTALDNVAILENAGVFCSEFGIEEPDISAYYPFGRADNTSREWLIESSLDTQWLHAFAPDAVLAVVFAKNADVKNLLSAAEYAQKQLSADVICMCFGTEESVSDESLSAFMKDGGIFVASSGDVGGRASFPSTSPYCISAGGTNLFLSPSGRRISETAWINGGGGKSDVFEIPFYQGRFFNIYGMADGMRGTPDVSMMANYNPGVPVYVSQLGGWTTAGGTSLSAACFAGMCACIKQKHPEITTSVDMLSFLYSKAGGDGYELPQYNFYDVTIGKSGDNYAMDGWDFATGLGSPVLRRILS